MENNKMNFPSVQHSVFLIESDNLAGNANRKI